MVTSGATLARLREAIRTRQPLAFRANGFERILSPHVLGTKDGAWRLFGWQSGGGSTKGLKPGGEWRCFAVANISDLRAGEGPWQLGESTADFGLSCIDLIDTAADLEYASKSLRQSKRKR